MTQGTPTISVIIPVYNTLNYLERCFESICSQTFNDYEVILIDDGSSDGSIDYCKEFTKKNHQFKLYCQNHKKAAAARNYGMRIATGQYLFFLDSDDYIDNNLFKQLVSSINNLNIDIIRYSFNIDNDGNIQPDLRRRKIPEETVSGPDYFKRVYQLRAYSCHVGLGLYKRSFLINNDLFFWEGITHEDELWMPSVLVKAKLIKYLNIFGYYHVMRAGSVMHQIDKTQNGIDLITVAYNLEKVSVPAVCQKEWDDNLLGKYYLGFCWSHANKNKKIRINKVFPIRHSRNLINILRFLIYFINYDLFYTINGYFVNRNEQMGIRKS